MDAWVSILMVALFIVLLIFIFSAALLTPIIGKKNLLFVIFIGFLVGAVGGAFFISPVYEDVPEMARGFYQLTSDSPETIMVDVSTNINITQFMSQARELDGVYEVDTQGILLKTDNFTETRKQLIEDRISIADPNIESADASTDGNIRINVKAGYNPTDAIDKLSDWLMFTGGINTRYSVVQLTIEADPSKADNIINEISKEDVVVTGVQGPVEDRVRNLRELMPGQLNIVLFCGLLGMITGVAGVFVDNIIYYIELIKEKFKQK